MKKMNPTKFGKNFGVPLSALFMKLVNSQSQNLTVSTTTVARNNGFGWNFQGTLFMWE